MRSFLFAGVLHVLLSSSCETLAIDFEEISKTPLVIRYGEETRTREYFEAKVLPEYYQVHLNEGHRAYQVIPDYSFRTIRVYNIYSGSGGGYIACYSNSPDGSFYKVPRTDIYMHGLLRTEGVYDAEVFRPFAGDMDDIAIAESHSSTLCKMHIPGCMKNGYWAGGKTGSFVGIKEGLLMKGE